MIHVNDDPFSMNICTDGENVQKSNDDWNKPLWN
jgi:hypothetical protein